jgi:hypothetical protein
VRFLCYVLLCSLLVSSFNAVASDSVVDGM